MTKNNYSEGDMSLKVTNYGGGDRNIANHQTIT